VLNRLSLLKFLVSSIPPGEYCGRSLEQVATRVLTPSPSIINNHHTIPLSTLHNLRS